MAQTVGSQNSSTSEYNEFSSSAQSSSRQLAMLGAGNSDLTVVGSALYPAIFLFYIGDINNQGDISTQEAENIILKLKTWSESTYGASKETGSGGTDLYSAYYSESTKTATNKAKKYAQMYKSAIEKNPNYSWMLANACVNLLAKYKGRIPVQGGAYYQNSEKSKTSYYPVIDVTDPYVTEQCMKLLSLLLYNNLIDYTYDLGIRPLNIQDGSFYEQEQYSASLMHQMRNCGKPVKGQFTVNSRNTAPQFYHTFSGVDITAIAAVGNVVTRLEGLTQISWSIHSGKSTQKPLGKTNGGSRSSGTRTIAGTMVFTLFDHHPLLDLLPSDLTKYNDKGVSSGKQKLYRPRYMPDQIPPFDVTIVLMNEYGYCSIVSLYGVQVPDEGSVVSVDNLVTEVVCQYTAVAMDPIVQVQADESGNVDPFGIVSGGWSDMWRQREIVISGVAYTDLEKAYESFYDTQT